MTGESRVHEFKRYDGLLQNEESGKCSGVSNVKGNTEYGPCKYDVKLTDIAGVQVSLGRISGANALLIANSIVTSFLRGEYEPHIALTKIQSQCRNSYALEPVREHTLVDESTMLPIQEDVTVDTTMCPSAGSEKVELEMISVQLQKHRKQIKNLKRDYACIAEDINDFRRFRKCLTKSLQLIR